MDGLGALSADEELLSPQVPPPLPQTPGRRQVPVANEAAHAAHAAHATTARTVAFGTAGYAPAEADDAIQASIVAAGYGK